VPRGGSAARRECREAGVPRGGSAARRECREAGVPRGGSAARLKGRKAEVPQGRSAARLKCRNAEVPRVRSAARLKCRKAEAPRVRSAARLRCRGFVLPRVLFLAGSVSAWVLQALSRGRLQGLSTAGTTPFSRTTRRPARSPYGRSPRLESPTLEDATGVRKRLHNATCSGVALARPRTSARDPVSVCSSRSARATRYAGGGCRADFRAHSEHCQLVEDRQFQVRRPTAG
jgi:hypothetical protein